MYRTINDFLEDWKEESSFTLNIFEAIAEEKRSDKVNTNVRSLERLAWHLTQTLTEMPFRAGIFESDFLEHQPVPGSFKEIIAKYKEYSDLLLQAVPQRWNDNTLNEEINMYGENWKKGKVLSVLIRHQTHHRGQMTTLMRLLDLKVPGTYGPSKEEWANMGLPAMD